MVVTSLTGSVGQDFVGSCYTLLPVYEREEIVSGLTTPSEVYTFTETVLNDTTCYYELNLTANSFESFTQRFCNLLTLDQYIHQ